MFHERFKCISGLILSKTYSKDAAEAYVTKIKTRVEGPFYAGKKNKFNEEFANSMILKPWQDDLFNFLKRKESFLRNRKVIYVENIEISNRFRLKEELKVLSEYLGTQLSRVQLSDGSFI